MHCVAISLATNRISQNVNDHVNHNALYFYLT